MALDEPTPIMLANHVYWNLGAFTQGTNATVLNDTLYMPYADRYIPVDSLEVPLGTLGIVNNTALDFASAPKQIGADILNADYCGANCIGYDNAFILDRPSYTLDEDAGFSVLTMSSPATGIQLDVLTNQQGLQIYSCVGQNGTIGVKQSQEHGANGAKTYVQKYGCLVIETQDWIDAINQPQWGRQKYQIYSPFTPPAVNYAIYRFSTNNETSA